MEQRRALGNQDSQKIHMISRSILVLISVVKRSRDLERLRDAGEVSRCFLELQRTTLVPEHGPKGMQNTSESHGTEWHLSFNERQF